MIVLSSLSAALLAAMAIVSLYNLLTAPRLHRASQPASRPRVSLLVPARDEEMNLRRTLPAMLASDWPELEVLVLDDGSTDGTAALVEQMAETSERLRLVRGEPLPLGWLGKSWACSQLAEAARGEWLIFCDADVTPGPEAVRRTVGAAQAADAGVVTALPRQRMESWAEAAVIPLIAHLSVLALLPLRLLPRLRSRSLAVGNGQWIAFSRPAYLRIGGHAAVRSRVVEDVELARRAVGVGERLLVTLAPRTLEVRMYRGYGELGEGFGKNLYALTGATPRGFAIAAFLFALTAIYPWAGALGGASGAVLPLVLLAIVRLCGLGALRHGIVSVLLHPVGALVASWIGILSYRRTRGGRAEWKGRRLPPAVR